MKIRSIVRFSASGLLAAGLVCGAGSPAFAQASKAKPAPKSTTPKTTTTATTTAKKPVTRTSVARAQAAARARAAAAARVKQNQQREASSPKFKRDAVGNLIPDVRAAASIVFNPKTGEVLYEENSHEPRAIASLTKIMTAVTFVADEPDFNSKIRITREDMLHASTTHLKTGDEVTLNDLLHLTLIASDNAAARALARTSEGGTPAFISRMNDMAKQLDLTDTHYFDPSGLFDTNVSSAYDISHLISFAATDPKLSAIMRTSEYVVQATKRQITIHSTNKLLSTDMDVLGGKTGFIRKAGYCLATLLQVPQGSQVAVVVLGAANSATRFWEARHLFNWVVGKGSGIIGDDDGRVAPGAIIR